MKVEDQYKRNKPAPHRYSDHDLRGSKPFKTFRALVKGHHVWVNGHRAA